MSLSDVGRRGFIGSVIGTSLATGLPFTARAAEPTIVRKFPTDAEQLQMFLKFLRASKKEQLRYKFFLMLDREYKDIIYGASIVSVNRSGNTVTVLPEEIQMRTNLTSHGFIFAEPDGTFMKPLFYDCGGVALSGPTWDVDKETGHRKLTRGDLLKHTYTLQLS